ncbi:MAG: NUDIX domain-containing protein [Marinilabiliaceae bacterium]
MGEEKYCYDYPRPAVTADVVALAGRDPETLSVLLIRRNMPPFKGMWALPGGFVNIDEELEDAAARELEEETGLNRVDIKQIGAFGKVGRDPRHRTVTIAFLATPPYETVVKGGDDARDAGWFPVSDLPDLAFDHDEIISAGMKMWKSQTKVM